MPSLVDMKGEWVTAIGKAFVAFGSIEHVTIVCLQEIPRDRIQRSTKSFGLAQRIDLLLEILEAHSGTVFTELAEKLKQAKNLAKTRNLIAHNPLVLDIYEREDGAYLHRESIVALNKKEQHITLPELQEFAAISESLASELYSCSSQVFKALSEQQATNQ